jgi:hypothetical protein
MLQLQADGARRDIKPCRGPRNRAMFHDSEKDFKLTQIHSFRCPDSANA